VPTLDYLGSATATPSRRRLWPWVGVILGAFALALAVRIAYMDATAIGRGEFFPFIAAVVCHVVWALAVAGGWCAVVAWRVGQQRALAATAFLLSATAAMVPIVFRVDNFFFS
jgi:hypothetical protein